MPPNQCPRSNLGSALAVAVVAITGLSPARANVGNPEIVRNAYGDWRQASVGRDGQTLTVGLGWSRGYSDSFTSARGRLTLDRATGAVSTVVRGLPPGSWDVWLIDNAERSGATPDPADDTLLVGRLEQRGDELILETAIPRTFAVDVVVVAQGGLGPGRGTLHGAPTLFQRHWHGLRSASTSLGDLVREGERIFFEETFAGNGRTCGSCHPAENNFTIDPTFIATLAADDPLFVAEFVPELAENFEKPELMREFGLILENVDGFDDLENRFVMRGVPHMLAMTTSLAPAFFDSSGGGLVPPFERTGWSGDGAPGNGTLREFALGAVIQHFPRSLARTPGVDFRVPTDDELDALEAFSLSLGRGADPDLEELYLTDPVDRAGRDLFLGSAQCFECHANAGANAAFLDPGGTQNTNFDTGVQRVALPGNGPPLPPDGGFGLDPHPGGGFGDGRFNTPPVVEAADTGPFFHNNAIETIEDAIEFYNSDEFAESPAGIFVDGITMTEEEVRTIGVFLRVLNALENIRSSADLAERASISTSPGRDLTVAGAEIGDATRVLQERGIHLAAVRYLIEARDLAAEAAEANDPIVRGELIERLLVALETARRRIQYLGELPDTEIDPPRQITGLRASPNPGRTPEVVFRLSSRASVTVDVFDVRGRRVVPREQHLLGVGRHAIRLDLRDTAAGVYFVRVLTPGDSRTVRIVRSAR